MKLPLLNRIGVSKHVQDNPVYQKSVITIIKKFKSVKLEVTTDKDVWVDETLHITGISYSKYN